MILRFPVHLTCAFGLLAIAASRCPAAEELVPDAALAAELQREAKIIERYLSLLERNPREGTSLDRAYGHFVEQGRIDELVDRYRARVKDDETDGVAWMILGLIESRRGNDASAVKSFTKAKEHRADDPLAAYYLGRSLSIAGRPERAIAAFEEAIARKPARSDLPAIFVALGRLQGRFGQAEKAGEVWERLEAAFPGDLRVKAEIAAVLENQGQVELALERYAELAKSADDEYRKVTYALKAAEMKVRLSKSDEAIADYEALLANLNPDNWLYREVRRGIENVFLRTEDLDGLASYYQTWIEKHPEDVQAMTRLAAILTDLGRADDARTWFEKAVRLAPSDVRLRRAYIRSLRRGGKTKAAIAQFEALDKLMPNNPDVIRDWGTVYLEDDSLSEEQRKAKAAEIWKRLLAGEKDDPVVTAQVADWLRQADMTDEALALYARAVQQAPDDPRYLEYLGEYQHRLGNQEAAVATWKKLAAGENRTRAILVRLADVLSGFGYKQEAVAVFREADAMNLEFAARLQFAELLREQEKYDAALKQIAKAESLAESDQERQQALLDRIETDRDAGRLDERIVELKKQAEANPSAQASLTLALYLDASRDWIGAIDAVRTAVKLDPGSIPAQATLAKLADSAGQLTAAAEAFHRLAALDRRGRTEYLKQVASLERRLGKVDEALKTGREVLASSPGNPDAYSFYADLCFQSGQTEKGFDALRRAVRLAPGDTGALLKLATALAEQFRTDEAVELYWQAFDKAEAFDDKQPIVGRLATLYLRTDRFKQLIDRLKRTTVGDDRETQLLIAQAHQSVGDIGKARKTLEDLLAKSPRDTGLLEQLSALAEQNNDYESALRYQREIVELAPENRATKARLARLYLASDIEATDEFWDSLVADELDHIETISLIDAMLGAEKYDDALRLTNRGLREKPQDWELLYRRAFVLFQQEEKSQKGKDEGDGANAAYDRLLALAAPSQEEEAKEVKKDDATAVFERLLTLDLPDDTEAAKLAALHKRNTGTSSSAASPMASLPKIFQRLQAARQSQAAFGFSGRTQAFPGMAASSRRSTWTPNDYGSARLAAIGWLNHEAPDCDFLTELNLAAKAENAAARTLWDWFYLLSYKTGAGFPPSDDGLEAARRLAKLGDANGAWIYLVQLAGSRRPQQNPNELSKEELDLMLACYERVRHETSSPYASVITSAVAQELGRAGREEQARKFVHDLLATIDNPQTILVLLRAAEGAQDDAIVEAVFERFESLPPDKLASARGNGRVIAKLMRIAWDAGDHDKTLELLDRQLALGERRLEATQHRSGSARPSNTNYGIVIWKRNGSTDSFSMSDSQMNGYLGIDEMTVLLNAVQFFKEKDYEENETIDDLVAHLTKRAEAATGPKAAMSYLAIAAVHKSYAGQLARRPGGTSSPQPADEAKPDAAFNATQKAMQAAPKDYGLRLTFAKLLTKRNRNAEALALLEEVEPFDLEQLRDRELLVLDIAPDLGKQDRAQAAAKRLFGLRLDSDTQLKLAKSMQRIGMSEQADAVLARLRGQGGGSILTQIKLLRHYKGQGDSETAVEIARTIIRRTNSSAAGRGTAEETYRHEAVRVLKQAGQLDGLIADARRRAKGAPNSVDAQKQLAEYLSAAGKATEAAAVLTKISKKHPEDADLKFALAGRIIAMGKADEAIALYKTALEGKSKLTYQDIQAMRDAFNDADRSGAFLKLLGQVDYSKGAPISYAARIASNSIHDEKLKDEALTLLDTLLSKNEDQRSQVLQQISNEEAWNDPKIVGHALDMLKEDGTSLTWQSLSNATSFAGDGKIRTLFNNLSKAAQSDARKKEFQTAITEIAKNNPKWQPGQALLAIVEANQDKHKQARKRIQTILDDETTPITARAAWAVAVELEPHEPLRDLTIELLESAIAGDVQLSNSFEYQPGALLVDIYIQAGKKRKARELILTKGMVLPDLNYGNPQLEAYSEMARYVGIGDKLVELGYPIDALRVYDQYAADPDRTEAAQGHSSESVFRLLEKGREQALKQITPANVAAYLDAASKEGESPSLDLMLTVNGDDFSERTINSVIITAIKNSLGSANPKDDVKPAAGDTPAERLIAMSPPTDSKKRAEVDAARKSAESIASIKSDIAALVEKRPNDQAVQIIAAITAYSLGDLEAARQATARLAALDEAAAKAASASDAKDQAKVKAAQLRRVALWLVAREAARHDQTQALGDELADRALAAAKSLADQRWATALSRERGQSARGADEDEDDAKSSWWQALDILITPAKSEK